MELRGLSWWFSSFPHPPSQHHQVNHLNIIGWTHLFKLYFNENFSQLYPPLLDEGGNDGLVVADVLLVVLDSNGLPVHPQVLIAEDVVHSCSIPAEILIGFDIFFYAKILQNSYLDVVWLPICPYSIFSTSLQESLKPFSSSNLVKSNLSSSSFLNFKYQLSWLGFPRSLMSRA